MQLVENDATVVAQSHEKMGTMSLLYAGLVPTTGTGLFKLNVIDEKFKDLHDDFLTAAQI